MYMKGAFGNSKKLLFYDVALIYILAHVINLLLHFLFLKLIYILELLPLRK